MGGVNTMFNGNTIFTTGAGDACLREQFGRIAEPYGVTFVWHDDVSRMLAEYCAELDEAPPAPRPRRKRFRD